MTAPAQSTAEVDPVFSALYRVLSTLKARGYQPDFVVDIGSSNGCWSATCQLVFSAARYVLVEPLGEEYDSSPPAASKEFAYFPPSCRDRLLNTPFSEGRRRSDFLLEQFPQFELVQCAVTNYDGEVSMNVANDAWSSSLFALGERTIKTLSVPCKSLLTISRERNLTGRGIVKIDAESSEYRILLGAGSFLDHVDIAIIEVSVYRFYSDTRPYDEVLDFMKQRGFQYFDDAGDHRQDGLLTHKDVVFARSELAREQLELARRRSIPS